MRQALHTQINFSVINQINQCLQSHQRANSQITLAPYCNLFTIVFLPSPSWTFLGIPKGFSYSGFLLLISGPSCSKTLLWCTKQALKIREQVWFIVILCKLRTIPYLLLYLGYLKCYFVLLLLDMFVTYFLQHLKLNLYIVVFTTLKKQISVLTVLLSRLHCPHNFL